MRPRKRGPEDRIAAQLLRSLIEFPDLRVDLPADLLDAAFALKDGEISAVIEDDSHYRILNTVEHRDGSLVPLEKVREQIVAKLIKEAPAKLIKEAQAKRIQGWIEQARKEHAEAMDGA